MLEWAEQAKARLEEEIRYLEQADERKQAQREARRAEQEGDLLYCSCDRADVERAPERYRMARQLFENADDLDQANRMEDQARKAEAAGQKMPADFAGEVTRAGETLDLVELLLDAGLIEEAGRSPALEEVCVFLHWALGVHPDATRVKALYAGAEQLALRARWSEARFRTQTEPRPLEWARHVLASPPPEPLSETGASQILTALADLAESQDVEIAPELPDVLMDRLSADLIALDEATESRGLLDAAYRATQALRAVRGLQARAQRHGELYPRLDDPDALLPTIEGKRLEAKVAALAARTRDRVGSDETLEGLEEDGAGTDVANVGDTLASMETKLQKLIEGQELIRWALPGESDFSALEEKLKAVIRLQSSTLKGMAKAMRWGLVGLATSIGLLLAFMVLLSLGVFPPEDATPSPQPATTTVTPTPETVVDRSTATSIVPLTVAVSPVAETPEISETVVLTKPSEDPTNLATPTLTPTLEIRSVDGPSEGGVDRSYAFTATFGASASDLDIKVEWDASGGERASDPRPVEDGESTRDEAIELRWLLPGPQTVTVTASYETDAVSATHEIYIYQLPADLTIDGPKTGALTGVHTFTATILLQEIGHDHGVSYVWEATDQKQIERQSVEGTAATTDTIRLDWDKPGPKTITVTVWNPAGSISDTHEIDIVEPSSLRIYGPAQVRPGEPHAFVAVLKSMASVPVTFTWQAPESTLEGQGTSEPGTYVAFSLGWPATGTYTVEVTATHDRRTLHDGLQVEVVEELDDSATTVTFQFEGCGAREATSCVYLREEDAIKQVNSAQSILQSQPFDFIGCNAGGTACQVYFPPNSPAFTYTDEHWVWVNVIDVLFPDGKGLDDYPAIRD